MKSSALDTYQMDLQRERVLSHEEQLKLARRYIEKGDADAAAALVTGNLRLVMKLARELKQGHDHLSDLIQEGNLGLMHAVRKYDPERGVRFSTYASWWIRAYMLRFIVRNARLVRIGTTQAHRKLFFRLKREMSQLESRGQEATPKVIAERLEVTEDDVVEMMKRLSGRDVSVDEPIAGSERGGMTFLDTIASAQIAADDEMAEDERWSRIQAALVEFEKGLQGREALLFRERLLASDPQTLQELGVELGVSRERARQLESALKGKLEKFLRRELPRDLLAA